MKFLLTTLTILALSIVAAPASANNPTQTFATCLVDTLDGKERKSLAKWIFFSLAAHPEISPYSKATQEDIQESDVFMGQLVTRLLVDACPAELKAANAADPRALQSAFELVGQVAMQELMTNDEVMRTLTNYATYADLDKINSLMAP